MPRNMLTLIFAALFVSSTTSFQVLHLADFHMDVQYSIHGNKQKMCHDDGEKRQETLGTYGDYLCDSPKPLVVHAVEEASRICPDPDLIIYTGDNVAHIDGYDWNLVFDVVNQSTSLLFTKFPNKTILPTFGNHDFAPANAFQPEAQLYAKVWQLWKSRIGEENQQTFLRGGYYKYRLKNATALVLNTNLYYNENRAYDNFTDKHDPAGQFQFLREELEKAEQCPNRVMSNCTSIVHIIAHIGPGAFERTPNFTWFRDEFNEHFLNLTIRHSNSIGWMLFGHHHTDTFHLIKDSLENVVQVALMAPAVTPWFSSLQGAGANNPTFRVYDTDQYSAINDIRTYFIDLNELNKNSSTQFKLEYSFKDAYDVTGDINIAAMSKVVENLKNNESLFEKYIRYNSAFWNPTVPKNQYRGAQLCSLEFADYPRYSKCLAKYSNDSSRSDNFSFILFALLSIFYDEICRI